MKSLASAFTVRLRPRRWYAILLRFKGVKLIPREDVQLVVTRRASWLATIVRGWLIFMMMGRHSPAIPGDKDVFTACTSSVITSPSPQRRSRSSFRQTRDLPCSLSDTNSCKYRISSFSMLVTDLSSDPQRDCQYSCQRVYVEMLRK
jgi:hypothetical protein